MQITKFVVGPMNNNAYLLRCETSSEQVLIDAAEEAALLLEAIGPAGLVGVVTTHRHADHWGALEPVAVRTGAQTIAGAPDADALPLDVDRRVWSGDRIEFGEVTLDVIGLVGHTPGSIALAWSPSDGPSQIFTGDSLFPGGVGKTWSDADFESLINDVEAKIFDVYADDTLIHPGHGDSTTLGAERPKLAGWRSRRW